MTSDSFQRLLHESTFARLLYEIKLSKMLFHDSTQQVGILPKITYDLLRPVHPKAFDQRVALSEPEIWAATIRSLVIKYNPKRGMYPDDAQQDSHHESTKDTLSHRK